MCGVTLFANHASAHTLINNMNSRRPPKQFIFIGKFTILSVASCMGVIMPGDLGVCFALTVYRGSTVLLYGLSATYELKVTSKVYVFLYTSEGLCVCINNVCVMYL